MTRAERHRTRGERGWQDERAGQTGGPLPDPRRHVVQLRGWPGLGGWRAPTVPTGYEDRLGERNALVLHAAADADGDGDRFGLAAVRYVAGPAVVAAAVLVRDDLGRRRPEALATVEEWAATHTVSERPGAPRWQVLTLSEFFDPFARVGCGHIAFGPDVYTGGAFVIGADLGRFFGLVADHVGAARVTKRGEYWRGGWTVHLPGWGTRRGDGRWYRRSPNRPELRLKARRVGWQLGWGACGKDSEGRRYGSQHPGEFVDLLSLAYTVDADRGASFGEHRQDLGLQAADLPLAVAVDATGTEQLTSAVATLHESALHLDSWAADWFTTPNEREEGRGRVSLARVSSPGALAGELLGRFRVAAPLAKFTLDDAEHRAWAESFHGGRISFDERFAGWSFRCAAFDLTSAFPAVAHLLDWWRLLTADHLEREDVTDELRRLCEMALADPTAALDPSTWARFGCTLVEVLPDGERFPVEVHDERRPDGRTETTKLFSPERPMFYAWADVVAAAVLSGRVPDIIAASRLVPVGRQAGLRKRLPFLPGLALDLGNDPVIRLVEHRRRLKADGRLTEAALLRVVANALCFGILARFDESRWGTGRTARAGERPGPWNFLPLASSVTAGTRLLLAVFEAMVSDGGGRAVYCDTDSWLVPASTGGGPFRLPDGSVEHELSWSVLDEIAACFEPLGVFGPDVPMWKCERGTGESPLRSVVFGAKRHVEFVIEGGEVVIVERTDANLGGFYADPATMTGRADDKDRLWSLVAVRREVAYAIDRQRDAGAPLRTDAPWDAGQARQFPALFRRAVVSPEVLRSLASGLGARPGSRFIEGLVEWFPGRPGKSVAALDPGGDLADWRALRWFDRKTGVRVAVDTDWPVGEAVPLATLDAKGADWSRPPPHAPIDEVHVDPLNVYQVGRISGVIDALLDGLPGGLRSRRPVYEDRSVARASRAVRLGQGWTRRCECGCGAALGRRDQRWFSNAHRIRASRKDHSG